MRFDWDPHKSARNLAKHGVSFESAPDLDWTKARVVEDTRFDYGETRFLAYVPLRGRLHVLVFARRTDRMRIISLRKANPREIGRYGQSEADRTSGR